MTDDAELLRRFAEAHAEAVFSELVQRHLGLVYHAALRLTGGDAAQARETTQAVFAELAHKIPPLSGGATLVGWLHASTCRAAAQTLRADHRRARNERMVKDGDVAAGPGGAGEAERISAVLDEALGALGERDRDAVLLHFLEGRPFVEIGDAHFISEEAARVRTNRALEKLQEALAQRGVVASTASLGAVLEQQGGRTPPSGLAAAVTMAALAPSDPARGGLVKSVPATAHWALALGAGLVALAAAGTAILQWQRAQRLETELVVAEQALDEARTEAARLQTRLDGELRRAQAADEDNARLIEAMDRLAQLKMEDNAAAAEPPARVTQETVNVRFRRAGELMRLGRYDEALRDYLWCFDDGMPRFAVFAGVRSGSLINELAELARRHPPTREALRERREQAEQRMRASATEREAAADFAALNDALGESARTLREFERLEPDDPRREGLGARAFEPLVVQKRYRDAMQARSFATMRTSFELASSLLAENTVAAKGSAASSRAQSLQRDAIARTTARDVEVLAGVGELAQAEVLIAALLEIDDSPPTRTLLQQSLVRAGKPQLLAR